MLDCINQLLTWLSLALLFSIIMSKISTTFNYYMKMFVLYCSYMFTGTVLIPYGVWNWNSPWKASRLSADIIEPINQLLGIEYNITGVKNIDKSKAYVVVCNHQSSLDVLAVMQVWKLFDRAAIVAKRELQYAGTFGLGIKLCGTVFVDRASSEAGRAAINKAGNRAKETGTSLWVFPEGTRNHTDTMLPFKKGAFHVAVDCNMPILPIVLSEYSFLDHKRKIFGKGRIDIQILEPISIDAYKDSKEGLNNLVEETRSKMMKAQKNKSE